MMTYELGQGIITSAICAQLYIYTLGLDLLHLSINKTTWGYMGDRDRQGSVVNISAINQVAKGQ